MQRRKFITTAAAASALPLSCAASTKILSTKNPPKEKELYEFRTYELKFGGNQKLLLNYLKEALKPAMMRAGVNHFMLLEEVAKGGPKKIYLVISYPTAAIYLQAQNLQGDVAYVTAAATYNAAEKSIYNRYDSWLLHAFDGFPQLETAPEGVIYELRTYESFSDDALRRKIKMFNDEEVPIFRDAGLIPVFFGEMLAGPYRPALTYMIRTKDMEASGQGWQNFIKHPDWNRIKVMPEYANTVSNIRNVFLRKV
ncbi:MAG: NIPSNAP family protein [Saprospiraceae bacterium]